MPGIAPLGPVPAVQAALAAQEETVEPVQADPAVPAVTAVPVTRAAPEALAGVEVEAEDKQQGFATPLEVLRFSDRKSEAEAMQLSKSLFPAMVRHG